jgi:hypothetical protein
MSSVWFANHSQDGYGNGFAVRESAGQAVPVRGFGFINDDAMHKRSLTKFCNRASTHGGGNVTKINSNKTEDREEVTGVMRCPNGTTLWKEASRELAPRHLYWLLPWLFQ